MKILSSDAPSHAVQPAPEVMGVPGRLPKKKDGPFSLAVQAVLEIGAPPELVPAIETMPTHQQVRALLDIAARVGKTLESPAVARREVVNLYVQHMKSAEPQPAPDVDVKTP